MTQQSLKETYANLSLQELCGHLYSSASNGNLDEIKYLLTSPDLKHHPRIDFANDSALVVASTNGFIPIVEYLLNFPNYGNQTLTDWALIKSCVYGQLELAKFLLDSDTIPHKPNIHAKQDYVFREVLVAQNTEILSYLIFDREIPKTKDIELYLNQEHYNLNGFVSEIKTWFDKRELKAELKHNLDNSKLTEKKPKI